MSELGLFNGTSLIAYGVIAYSYYWKILAIPVLSSIINYMNNQSNLFFSAKSSFLSDSKKNGFTLVELIIVVIIVGILASLGLTQYSIMVEKSRTAEAKVRIGVMRQLAHEYYFNNGVMTSMQNADAGVDRTCTSDNFYNYWVSPTAAYVSLVADRCTSGGKSPNVSRTYRFQMVYYPATGNSTWYCRYMDDNSPCFGLPPVNT